MGWFGCDIIIEHCMFYFSLTAGYLVYEFDKFWFEEKPESIMYFNIYREKFHEKIKGLLLDCNVSLTLKMWIIPSTFYFYNILHTQQNLYVVIEISDQLYCLYIISYKNISEILFKKASGQSVYVYSYLYTVLQR